MKLIFAGDSITEGITGDSYLKLFQKKDPRHTCVNLGLGGDTMIGITDRLIKYLRKHDDAQGVFIQAGHNDIILPSFRERPVPFRAFSAFLEKRGSVPTEESIQFRSLYARRIEEVMKLHRGPIMLMTLSCVNEDLKSETDRLRQIFNDEIRLIAKEFGLNLIDIGAAFNRELASGGQNYSTSTVRDVFIDGLLSKLPNGTSRISEMRDLKLTIDGVHLNRRGAELYERLVSEAVTALER